MMRRPAPNSAVWIDHLLKGTFPPLDDLERRKIVEEAGEKIVEDLTREIQTSRR
jgi:hypothetical protein